MKFFDSTKLYLVPGGALYVNGTRLYFSADYKRWSLCEWDKLEAVKPVTKKFNRYDRIIAELDATRPKNKRVVRNMLQQANASKFAALSGMESEQKHNAQLSEIVRGLTKVYLKICDRIETTRDERDRALNWNKSSRRECDALIKERDDARKERDDALALRENLAAALSLERDDARKDRDKIVSESSKKATDALNDWHAINAINANLRAMIRDRDKSIMKEKAVNANLRDVIRDRDDARKERDEALALRENMTAALSLERDDALAILSRVRCYLASLFPFAFNPRRFDEEEELVKLIDSFTVGDTELE